MKVLHAIDGSAQAAAAGRLLRAIADPSALKIEVVSAVPTGSLIPVPNDMFTAQLQRANELVVDEASWYASAGFESWGSVFAGDPGTEVLNSVERLGHDLVVMGGSTKRKVEKFLLGSVSAHVLRRASVPVLLVHKFEHPEGRVRILFGSDGGPASQDAERFLSKLLDPQRVRITVLSLVERPVPVVVGPAGAFAVSLTGQAEEQFLSSQLASATVMASATASRLRMLGFQAQAEADMGRPLEELVEEQRSRPFDLVAVGSRGLNAVGRLIDASVSERVVSGASAALVVKAQQS